MAKHEDALQILVKALEAAREKSTINKTEKSRDQVPLGLSNRHIHLSQPDLEKLFGLGYTLRPRKNLVQPGQYACDETLLVCGPKGCLEKVRILGPVRKDTQVELLKSDCYKLGIPSVIRMSGDLAQTPGVTLIGPKGSVELSQGAIVAQRHIHMHTQEAERFGLYDGQEVCIELEGLRGGRYDQVVIRANDSAALECHIDIEEGNAMGASNNTSVRIMR